MSHSNTAFHQRLKPLSKHEFEAEAKRSIALGDSLESIYRYGHIATVGRQSLRDIQSNFEVQELKKYSDTGSTGP